MHVYLDFVMFFILSSRDVRNQSAAARVPSFAVCAMDHKSKEIAVGRRIGLAAQ
jgi:hypothetical protein